VRRIGLQERRARLGTRHHLARETVGADVVEVTRSLVALHATDPSSVYLAARTRTSEDAVVAVERALYDDRSLVRMLGMRRTMFVVPVELAPVVQAGCTRAIAATERRRLVQQLEAAGIAADGARWLEEVEHSTLAALRARGEATAAELAAAEPRLREQMVLAPGKPYSTSAAVTTRVVSQLAADGLIVRGRPRGSWTSSQYRWAPVESWLPGGLPELPAEAARAELARRWLSAFGPGTAADLKWWTGWPAGQVSRALAAVGPVEVELDGTTTLLLADDLEPVPAPAPWVALLPALDPTLMGWSGREWYLGDHGPALFDRSGNPGPTVWCDGRIVGGWAQRKDGQVVVRLLEDIGTGATAAVREEAGRLTAWLGDVRVTPRFRTPLERELTT